MADTVQVTIAYEHDDEGWVTAQVLEVPAAIDQGRTRAEARTNVLQALQAALETWPELRPAARDHESVTVAVG